ncbi:MAG: hypothetical protein IH624_10950 [Phycisphaerae bacterium]|nr:hypothetical protein [Phycisphaerae bacterium]
MKRTIVIIMGVLILAAGTYIAVAARTTDDPARPQPGWGRRSQMGMRPMRWQRDEQGAMGMCPMHGGMMRSMMDRKVLPTEDGGVIVMIGCQLFKYDANLNLVGQTQVEVDLDAMQKKMQEIMEKCPVRKEMMEMQQDNGNGDEDNNQN